MDQTTDFDETYRNFFRNYAKTRSKIAYRLGNPRIRRISVKTLRHYGATHAYAQTKDLLYVKERLGGIGVFRVNRALPSLIRMEHGIGGRALLPSLCGDKPGISGC